MSSSSHTFTLGGVDDLPRPAAKESVVTAAPFAVAPGPAVDPGAFQPMVFTAFNGAGKIVSLHDAAAPALRLGPVHRLIGALDGDIERVVLLQPRHAA